MPHVTKADFDSRLAKHVSDQVKANQSNSQDYCVACCKSFSSEKSYKNHINSKKHAEASLRFESKENKVVMHQSFILSDVLIGRIIQNGTKVTNYNFETVVDRNNRKPEE